MYGHHYYYIGFDRYDETNEVTYSANRRLERSLYEQLYVEAEKKSKAQSRKKASRTGSPARPRTRVRKQVLQRTSEEAPNGYFDWEALSRLRKKGKY